MMKVGYGIGEHLNFDHIIKLRNNGAVKDIPNISKPYDSVCKPCQIGNLGHSSNLKTSLQQKNLSS
jgi:hypothetical protein